MNQTDVSKRSVGINFNSKGEAEIILWAPLAEKAEVLLRNKERLSLQRETLGYWKNTTDKIRPGDLYTFSLNGEADLPDPASLCQPDGVHGASQALDLNDFSWSDSKWKNFAQEEYIIYELHTGTFTGQGHFRGIEEKLDYLKDLGVNAIEIMPVAQFPGNRNWGYDGVFPFAVQDSYGGARGLQHLVNTCHNKGIAVILDVVYNHMGPEGNYLSAYGPYFTDKYKTPWGPAINFDDVWCDGVRNYFVENVLMWLRDFHIDALRLDAVHAIKDLSPTHILREIKQQVDKLMQETGRTHYLIVELDLNDTRFINPLKEQGYGMDGQWIDEFHHALRVTAGEEPTGYYADFDGIGHLAKAYKDAYVYDGIYSPHRFKKFGIKAGHNPGKQFVVFSQNHDQVGNRMLGERTSQLVSFEMQKLLAGAVLLSPFLPMLFMGEEYGELHPFQYFISHTDPDLVEAVRKGRRAEFAAFQTLGEAPDPQSEETFERSRLQWELLKTEPHNTLYRYYQTLISLRKQQAAFRNLNRNQLEVSFNKSQNTLYLHRWHNDQHVACIMNFSQKAQSEKIPFERYSWKKLLDSADPKWRGPAAAPAAIKDSETFIIQPESILIYTDQHV